MEVALIVELLVKAVLPVLVKECFTVCKTVIDDNRKAFDEFENIDTSIEALLKLNKSLKKENKFQREEIENLREMLKSCAVEND